MAAFLTMGFNLPTGKNMSAFLIDQGYAFKDSTSTKPKIKQDISELFVKNPDLSGFLVYLFFHSVSFFSPHFLRFYNDRII